ncbi:MAG: iron complex outermembrane receptor protein [Phenylobacterium sp.]|jgi:iron complex outermembrane receptor protein
MKKKAITLAIQAVLFGSATTSVAVQANETTAKIELSTELSQKQKPVAVVSLDQQKPVTEKITVTGSRLRRDSFSVATPLVTLGKDAIADTGLGSLAEILVDHMPAISASVSNATSQSSVSSTGLSTISLRDLGSNRTLTLIDGRRVVSNSYSSNAVSLSTIPTGMVERVEIISGGASATYGADAVAGVVNIITQSDQEGFSFKSPLLKAT